MAQKIKLNRFIYIIKSSNNNCVVSKRLLHAYTYICLFQWNKSDTKATWLIEISVSLESLTHFGHNIFELYNQNSRSVHYGFIRSTLSVNSPTNQPTKLPTIQKCSRAHAARFHSDLSQRSSIPSFMVLFVHVHFVSEVPLFLLYILFVFGSAVFFSFFCCWHCCCWWQWWWRRRRQCCWWRWWYPSKPHYQQHHQHFLIYQYHFDRCQTIIQTFSLIEKKFNRKRNLRSPPRLILCYIAIRMHTHTRTLYMYL